MLTLSDEIKATEARLKEAKVPLEDVLKVASVDRSTWTRWKNGSVRGARYDTMQRLREAVETAVGEAA